MLSMVCASFCNKLVLTFWLPLLISFEILLLIVQRIDFYLLFLFSFLPRCKSFLKLTFPSLGLLDQALVNNFSVVLVVEVLILSPTSMVWSMWQSASGCVRISLTVFLYLLLIVI